MKPEIEWRPKPKTKAAKITLNGVEIIPNTVDLITDPPKAKRRAPKKAALAVLAEKAKKATARQQPVAKTANDLQSLKDRLKPILSKSDFDQLCIFLDRLEKTRARNVIAQKAWRERQKK